MADNTGFTDGSTFTRLTRLDTGFTDPRIRKSFIETHTTAIVGTDVSLAAIFIQIITCIAACTVCPRTLLAIFTSYVTTTNTIIKTTLVY